MPATSSEFNKGDTALSANPSQMNGDTRLQTVFIREITETAIENGSRPP